MYFFDCKGCGVLLRPKPGDCCVFCSYGTRKCPPIQLDELLPPSRSKDGSLTFDLSVRVSERKGGGSPNVLGPYAQGKPDDRFIYLNSGTMAGQPESCFTRRAKLKTGGITWKLVEQAFADEAMLATQIEGTARDGGPCCATVPLLGGWKVSHA
jgi:hypothetical protein